MDSWPHWECRSAAAEPMVRLRQLRSTDRCGFPQMSPKGVEKPLPNRKPDPLNWPEWIRMIESAPGQRHFSLSSSVVLSSLRRARTRDASAWGVSVGSAPLRKSYVRLRAEAWHGLGSRQQRAGFGSGRPAALRSAAVRFDAFATSLSRSICEHRPTSPDLAGARFEHSNDCGCGSRRSSAWWCRRGG